MWRRMKMEKYAIGALHFSPIQGYEGYESYDSILEKAKTDLKAFEEGGISVVILENNYNIPHKTTKETDCAVQMMTSLVKDLMHDSKLSFGISVLFNDYKSALKIAHETGGQFVRVPAFVDDINTNYGKIIADSYDVIQTRKKLSAENVRIYADIQVKHATMMCNKPLEQSVLQAINAGADGLIVTGRVTGDPPKLNDLKRANAITSVPVLIGSGADTQNIECLLQYSNGVIVSTSLKEGGVVEGEVNVKPYDRKISSKKVSDFMCAVGGLK